MKRELRRVTEERDIPKIVGPSCTDLTNSRTSKMARNPDIVNALTAILLHAEAIRRRSTEQERAEVSESASHITFNARRIWRALEAAPK